MNNGKSELSGRLSAFYSPCTMGWSSIFWPLVITNFISVLALLAYWLKLKLESGTTVASVFHAFTYVFKVGFPFFGKKISILEMEWSGNLLPKPEFWDNSCINGYPKFSDLRHINRKNFQFSFCKPEKFPFYRMETVKFPVYSLRNVNWKISIP